MVFLCVLIALLLGLATAEDGSAAWLRYAPLPHASNYRSLPSSIIALNTTRSSPVYAAQQELERGILGIFGKQLSNGTSKGVNGSIIVGTANAYQKIYGKFDEAEDIEEDGYFLNIEERQVLILGQNERGALYGAFDYLSRLAQGKLNAVSYVSNPHAPIRWANEWDNLDGSIERGYAGPSIFFQDGFVTTNVTRAAEYARLLASIRINGIIINNVNANATLLSARNIDGLGRLADAMRPYGVQLGISLNFASPNSSLGTFDPLDPRVDAWWVNVTNQIYARVPDMAGYLVKANSEGQPGPLTYNRTLADGANMFARAAKPHGGIVMFRAFVYDNHINETNWKADRANAAVDFFKDLDGKFDENVVVQIKYGPIDFQVREPVSPLFSTLRKTNTAIELQITQEYLGQQTHLVYLGPLWKEILDFDLKADERPSKVRDIISGERFKRSLGGSAGVVNVGTNSTWLGSHLAMSNLYAYGSLAWDPSLEPEEVLQDWIRLTFGLDRKVIDTLTDMSMKSWPAYENYTGNLGIQTLTDILYTHFGPNPASQDNNGWGQWTRADNFSIGMDRTVKNGTGNAGQYPPAVADIYEDINKTPDDLLLWFHHVNYTHRLKSGKSVIQHFYDSHYEGAATAQTLVQQWQSLEGRIDDERYEHVLFRQIFQAGHALVWRDSINQFYYNLSEIPDEAKRVGKHPYRIEAEKMSLSGYRSYTVNPFHAASGYTAIVTTSNSTVGSATANITFASGTYDVAVNYYDLIGGKAQYELHVNNRTIGSWTGDLEDKLGHAPSIYVDGHSATRITFKNITIAKGDTLKIIITDTSSIARGLRNARHDVNAINSDLLAIKVSLDIARDDFSSSNPSVPVLLLEAASGFLDCCSAATERVHKPIVRLSASQDRTVPWQVLKAGELTGLKNDLEAVRCALDLLLDLVELFTEPKTECEITSPNRRSFFDDTDPEVWHMFLERVDVERKHIDEITQARVPTLYTSFDKLRRCASVQLEGRNSSHASPERLKLRTDHLGPPVTFGLSADQGKSLPPSPSPLSVSSGIGAWIANVVSQAIQSPVGGPPSFKLTNPRASFVETISEEDRAPSRGTFYSESIATSGTRTISSSKLSAPKRSSHQRVDSPMLVMKEPKVPRSKTKNSFYPIASTVFSSEERSIIHQRLTNDKIAVAKDTRRRLSRDQRAALDWILKNISTKTTPSEVEQILWEGADPNAADLEFGLVIIRAAYTFSTPILRLLVEYGADITQTSHTAYYSAIHAAVLGKQLQNVQWLVDMGIYFDTPNQQGETPLHLAVKTPGGYPIAKWLLEMGADVNREARDGTTPFQMVLTTTKVDSKERSMMMELLLAQGAEGALSAESDESSDELSVFPNMSEPANKGPVLSLNHFDLALPDQTGEVPLLQK
ncbi:hypothetical protein N0V90_003462 [Kalmusia sp. IMI 367209]|nr:hypothetical protein N0V90_003462 [Kalmusia sp. IMI 367209]